MPKSSNRHSELECFTLGLVWQIGPCTAYQVRKQMLDSPSRQWSGSAGAIYPLMRRLARRGLVRAQQQSTGRRKHEQYSITTAGLKALRAWVGPPMSEDAVTVTYDPLRSRARFLGALSAKQRREWVAAALQVLDEIGAKVETWEASYAESDAFLRLIARAGEIELQARRRWLCEAVDRVDGKRVETPSRDAK